MPAILEASTVALLGHCIENRTDKIELDSAPPDARPPPTTTTTTKPIPLPEVLSNRTFFYPAPGLGVRVESKGSTKFGHAEHAASSIQKLTCPAKRT